MAEYAFLLDLGRCIGCQACVVACKTGNELGDDQQYIHLVEKTQGEFPNVTTAWDNHRCFHCTEAACVAVCPTGALYKEDGLTRLDRDVCSGCAYCTQACPYDIPVMYEGRSSKCDGCAATTKAGGTPWCVATCPSDALMYGPRDEIDAEAHARAAALVDRYPDAHVYGDTQFGGLGMLVVMPGDPETLDIPANPKVPFMSDAWQKVVQPGAVALTLGAFAVAGGASLIARRRHEQEVEELEAAGVIGDGESTEQEES